MSFRQNLFDFPEDTLHFTVPLGMLVNMDRSSFEFFPAICRDAPKPNNRFEVYLDVQHYSPDDIRVKTVDGFVVVTGNHGEKQENDSWVQRKFQRKFPLPEGYTTEALQSQYTARGTLIITANLVRIEPKCDVPIKKKKDDPDNEPMCDVPIRKKDDNPENEPMCDVPIRKKEDTQENELICDVPIRKKENEPGQPTPDADGDQSEKKPVKPKTKRVIEIKMDIETKPSSIGSTIEKILQDCRI